MTFVDIGKRLLRNNHHCSNFILSHSHTKTITKTLNIQLSSKLYNITITIHTKSYSSKPSTFYPLNVKEQQHAKHQFDKTHTIQVETNFSYMVKKLKWL